MEKSPKSPVGIALLSTSMPTRHKLRYCFFFVILQYQHLKVGKKWLKKDFPTYLPTLCYCTTVRASVKHENLRVLDAMCSTFWSPPANRWSPRTPSSWDYVVQLKIHKKPVNQKITHRPWLQSSSPHTYVWQAYHLKQSKMVAFARYVVKWKDNIGLLSK